MGEDIVLWILSVTKYFRWVLKNMHRFDSNISETLPILSMPHPIVYSGLISVQDTVKTITRTLLLDLRSIDIGGVQEKQKMATSL